MSDEKKVTKAKVIKDIFTIQGQEVDFNKLTAEVKESICFEIQRWKLGGVLDVHRYITIMKFLGFPNAKDLPRGRELAMKFASELNELGKKLECKTIKGKSCCG
jgi:hypothetical protein